MGEIMECSDCQTPLVRDEAHTFCPTCDVKEYYFHIVTKYGPRECVERLGEGSAVVSGRNLLRT